MESITIISKLFEVYNAKLSAMEIMLKESSPTLYHTYTERVEEFKKKNEEHLMHLQGKHHEPTHV